MPLNREFPHPSAPYPTQESSSAQESDQDIALRLQNEEAYQAAMAADPPRRTNSRTMLVEKALTEDTSSSDEEYARRLQQEEDDRAVAVRLQQNERRNGVSHVHVAAPTTPSQPRRWSRRRICNAFFLLLILGGGTFFVLRFGDSIWERLSGGSSGHSPFFKDKWGDSNSSQYYFMEWDNDNKGLELEIVNALTEDWDTYFDRAVSEWNEASALSLSTSIANEPDPDCKPIRGLLKVCNKAYGLTGWTGLNQNIREGRYITMSVAKMNESYLSNAVEGEKQYVMCHEIGHGFGLPHRDERTNNPDLGTCLDYTVRPQNNMSPNEVDFENLKTLYGEIPVGNKGSRSLELTLKELEHEYGRLLHSTGLSAVYEDTNNDDVVVTTTVYFPLR